MTFNIQYIAVAAGHSLHIARAWANKKLAERAANAQHYDPVATRPHGPLLSMMVSVR